MHPASLNGTFIILQSARNEQGSIGMNCRKLHRVMVLYVNSYNSEVNHVGTELRQTPKPEVGTE